MVTADGGMGGDHPSVIINDSDSIFSDELIGYGSLRSRVRRAGKYLTKHLKFLHVLL